MTMTHEMRVTLAAWFVPVTLLNAGFIAAGFGVAAAARLRRRTRTSKGRGR